MSPNLWSGMFSKKLDNKRLFSFFTIGLTIINLFSKYSKNSTFHYQRKKGLVATWLHKKGIAIKLAPICRTVGNVQATLKRCNNEIPHKLCKIYDQGFSRI